jgi:hypothetical protein
MEVQHAELLFTLIIFVLVLVLGGWTLENSQLRVHLSESRRLLLVKKVNLQLAVSDCLQVVPHLVEVGRDIDRVLPWAISSVLLPELLKQLV